MEYFLFLIERKFIRLNAAGMHLTRISTVYLTLLLESCSSYAVVSHMVLGNDNLLSSIYILPCRMNTAWTPMLCSR